MREFCDDACNHRIQMGLCECRMYVLYCYILLMYNDYNQGRHAVRLLRISTVCVISRGSNVAI